MWYLYVPLFVFLLIIGLIVYLNLPLFGKAPKGNRLEKIKKSPNYKNGKFQNIHSTPNFKKGFGYGSVIYMFLFRKKKNNTPSYRLPAITTNLYHLPLDRDFYIWFGHSSYYLQVSGKRFLIDPVLTNNAAPLWKSAKAFPNKANYSTEDIPLIDYLIITHDHYDHLDYTTIRELQPKVKKVIAGLGVGSHLEYWGYSVGQIKELDWWQSFKNKEMELTATPARHFSGRKFHKNNTLWCSYVLNINNKKIYLGGDSGYDTHFKEIGEKFGPFDFAVLENGQYNEAWQYIHLLPNETVLAAQDLQAKYVIPVHSCKFSLSVHAWNEPLEQFTILANEANLPIITPKIGEVVFLDEIVPSKKWWNLAF